MFWSLDTNSLSCFSSIKTYSDSQHSNAISLSFNLKPNCSLEQFPILVQQAVKDDQKQIVFTGYLNKGEKNMKMESQQQIIVSESNILQSKLQLIGQHGDVLLSVFTDLQFHIVQYTMQWLDTISIVFISLTIIIVIGIALFYWIKSSQIKRAAKKPNKEMFKDIPFFSDEVAKFVEVSNDPF